MVSRRLDRMVAQVRRWRSGVDTDPLAVDPELSESDRRRLRRLIDECIDGKGGELAARRRASSIAATFLVLDDEGRRGFFRLLADEYDHDDAEVDRAIDAVVRAHDPDDRRRTEKNLRDALRPRRERLFRRFIGLEGGLPFLVDLREELLVHRKADAAMASVDDELRALLEAWFDLAMLQLEQLDWNSPAALLEKLIEYEAVHAIESWDDLKGRLGPGRRCYAFLHPLMPGEPLIFVEVALTRGIAGDLTELLDHEADRIGGHAADTAIFYSISNCHRGLAGVSLGDFLIKKVVEQLQSEFPDLKVFATLSPIPGFRQWLTTALDRSELLNDDERMILAPDEPDAAVQALRAVLDSDRPPPRADFDPIRPVLERLAARYLVREHRGQRAADPVAHFHLSNGARVERLNWMANPGPTGWDRGLGMMVNYRYDLRTLEANHDDYIMNGTIAASDPMAKRAGV